MSRERSGLTLVELALVVCLVGLLATIAAPRFGALRDGAAVRSAVSDAARTFATARELAVARRTAVAVVIDTTRAAIELRTVGQVVLRRDLSAIYRVALAANRDSMVYDARGLGFGASNLTLIVRRGSVADTIVISRLGRTRW